ncbi:MAG: FtsW/RodA/SpoVE family cell cycle protein [Actinomyces sp.]|uniref:FtsW/RodA/SpoVE family cell cycle protein n=1 Tax=Actinomyces sp. TaxID=29317 RepID=UPI0026DC32A4|nr:FtsW/RodA/SpoVE family cell cycle protein [Actinomyces sp.]MDO4242767.1 FtsW/RodA/SpoVE family cell cycle protein [Actinomyces sp.]
MSTTHSAPSATSFRPTPARSSGRWAEAGLLIIALLLGLGGFVLTALNRTGSSPAQVLQLGGALVVVAVVVHLWVRRTAPWADPVLLPVAVTLNGIGLAMIYRLDMSYKILGRTSDYGPKQALWTGLGVLLFCLVLLLRDHRLLRRWDRWAMWSGLVFLVLPFLPFVGRTVNGARIWVRLGPMSLQPAEFTKVLLAIFFASFLVSNRDNLALAGKRVLWMNLPRARHLGPLIIVWVVSILVLVLQRDLGSSVLLFGLFVVTLYVATDRISWLVLGGMLFLPAAWLAATHLSHVQQRITGWLDAMDSSVYNAEYGSSFQLVTALFGMASGGLLGSGWGEGYPNLVPFANSDFIFSSLGEELGLTGSLAILMLYLILVQRGLRTAMTLRDGFGKLLAVGLSFTIALQVFVVVGGVTRLIPLTGLTTPFLAYGGSSLLANWMILALLIRLSDAARRPASTAPRIIDTAELPVALRRHVQDATTPDEAGEDPPPPPPTPGASPIQAAPPTPGASPARAGAPGGTPAPAPPPTPPVVPVEPSRAPVAPVRPEEGRA